LDLCNDCDKLCSDEHNYIKLIIQIDSLVKFGVVYLRTIFILSLLLPFSMINFMSIIFLTDQMVNTRSGSGVDQPAVPRQGTSNNTNPDPQPSQPHQVPPAGMEQFLAAQTQLLTNMANTIANMQAQMNQAPPPPARDRHREFMSHKPPSFSHSSDPLQADDWIKTVEKILYIAQCTNREKVLYASGRLEGIAADWWDAYTAAHNAPNTIT
jgi:hypothetical protein